MTIVLDKPDAGDGLKITVSINWQKINEFTKFGKNLGHGRIAFQAHNKAAVPWFKNIKWRENR